MTRKSGLKVTLALILIVCLVLGGSVSAFAEPSGPAGQEGTGDPIVMDDDPPGHSGSPYGQLKKDGSEEEKETGKPDVPPGQDKKDDQEADEDQGGSQNPPGQDKKDGQEADEEDQEDSKNTPGQDKKDTEDNTATIHLTDADGSSKHDPKFESFMDVYVSFGAKLPLSENDQWTIWLYGPGFEDRALISQPQIIELGEKHQLAALMGLSEDPGTFNTGGVYKVVVYLGEQVMKNADSKNFRIAPVPVDEESPKDPPTPGTGEPGEGEGGTGETETEGTTEENGGGGSVPGTNPGTGGTGGSSDDEFAVFEDDEVPLSPGEMPVLPEEEEELKLVPEEEVVMEDDAVPLALPKTGGAADGLMVVPLLMTLAGYVVARKRF